MIAAGRRWGKSRLGAWLCVRIAVNGGRAWWVAPSYKMGAVGWRAIRQIAQQVPGAEVRHGERMITLPGGGTVQVRSADDPQSLRGEGLDYAVLDECAYMREEAWTEALRPALSDRRGGALFISTPHGLNWFRRLWQLGQSSEFDDWESWTFKTLDNPFIAADEVESARRTLLGRIFRQEYEADFLEDNPGALWRRDWIDARRVLQAPDLARVVVAVDPTATTGGDECGIIGAGMAVVGGHPHLYVLADASRYGSPREWASAVCTLYREIGADLVVAEANNGGEMVQFTLQTIDPGVRVKLVHASRGKATRAEPISAVYEQGRAHHVGTFAKLEDELCQWEPGDASPNRLDALVWAGTELVLGSNASAVGVQIDGVRLHKLGERRSRW